MSKDPKFETISNNQKHKDCRAMIVKGREILPSTPDPRPSFD
jgi:hypothetical protein